MEAVPLHVHVLNIYLQCLFIFHDMFDLFKKVSRKKFHWFIII